MRLGDIEVRLGALEILPRLGAEPLASRIRTQLRSDGVERIPRRTMEATREEMFGLTPRQSDVLRLLGEHLTNADIADRLYISPRTVEKHMEAVLDKLKVSTRFEAVAAADAAGFFAPSQQASH